MEVNEEGSFDKLVGFLVPAIPSLSNLTLY
jgi:hypothetical protein